MFPQPLRTIERALEAHEWGTISSAHMTSWKGPVDTQHVRQDLMKVSHVFVFFI